MDLDSDCGPVDIWTCTKHSKDLEVVCGSQDWETWQHPGGEERYFLFNLLKLGGRGGQKHRENNGYSGIWGQTVYGTRTLSSKNTSLAERRGTRCEPGTAQLKAVG